MEVINLLVALTLIGVGWLALDRLLRRGYSARGGNQSQLRLRPTARRRDNRVLLRFPVPAGPINSSSTVAVGRRKDLA